MARLTRHRHLLAYGVLALGLLGAVLRVEMIAHENRALTLDFVCSAIDVALDIGTPESIARAEAFEAILDKRGLRCPG